MAIGQAQTAEPAAAAPPASDAALVTAARGGDREAFGHIVERHQGLVCAIACAGAADVAYGEYLAQEAFAEAWGSLARLKDATKLRPWLRGVARSVVQQALREAEQTGPLDDGDEPHHAALSPTERAALADERALIARALERMPEPYREVLVLTAWASEPIAAEALGLTEDTVRQRVARGRSMLDPAAAARLEAGLARARPDRAFKLAVLTVLPAGAPDVIAAPSVPPIPASAGIAASGSGGAAFPGALTGTFDARHVLRETDVSLRAVLGAHAGFLASVLWILPLCWIAGDGLAAAATLAIAGSAYAAAAWATLRQPARYFRVAFWQGLATFTVLLVAVNLGWGEWMAAYRATRWYDAKGDLPLWLVNVLVLAVAAEVQRKLLRQDRLHRPH